MAESCMQLEHVEILADLQARTMALEEVKKEIPLMGGRVTELERTVDTMAERTHHYELKMESMDHSIKLLNEKQDTLKERMPSRDEWNAMRHGIAEIQGSGSKTWSRVKGTALTIIITVIVTIFATRFFNLFLPDSSTPKATTMIGGTP